MRRFPKSPIFFLPHDNTDTVVGGSGNDTLGGNSTVAGGNGNDTIVINLDDPELSAAKFTPEQQKLLNKRIAQEKAKVKAENDKTIAQLRQVQTQQGTTEKQKQDLEARIQELQNQHLTKEELARKEQEKQRNEYSNEKKRLTEEAESWKNRYSSAMIKRSITDSAVSADAWNPEQIVDILEKHARLVESVDAEGKPTGDMQPRIKLSDTDKDGKPMSLDLTVGEAVKRMKETPEKYGNLFKSGVAGGLGQGGNGAGRGGRQKPAGELTTAEYMEKRKKDKELGFTSTK